MDEEKYASKMDAGQGVDSCEWQRSSEPDLTQMQPMLDSDYIDTAVGGGELVRVPIPLTAPGVNRGTMSPTSETYLGKGTNTQEEPINLMSMSDHV